MANFLQLLKSTDSHDMVTVGDREIRQMQNSLLGMLDDIIGLCEENQIQYMLGGGSVLGAVRHQGFIPWDDDIDINMTRNSFDRFLPLFQERYEEKYWLHVPGQTQGYDLPMVHVISKTFYLREIMDSNHRECGLTVDIFILENTFDNVLLRRVHGTLCMALRYALSCIRFYKNLDELSMLSKNSVELQTIVKRRSRIGKLLSIIDSDRWARAFAHCIKICGNDQSRFVAIPSGQYHYFREMYPRKTYCKTEKTTFEGRQVPITADYDAYLKNLYGDYHRIPPVEDRQKHVLMEYGGKVTE